MFLDNGNPVFKNQINNNTNTNNMILDNSINNNNSSFNSNRNMFPSN
jgi:hypothetical protein